LSPAGFSTHFRRASLRISVDAKVASTLAWRLIRRNRPYAQAADCLNSVLESCNAWRTSIVVLT